MKIWEVHWPWSDGAIRTTADGDADVRGLLLSEKAYLLAMRDFRPAQLVGLVEELGPTRRRRCARRAFRAGAFDHRPRPRPWTVAASATRLSAVPTKPAAMAPLPGLGRTH